MTVLVGPRLTFSLPYAQCGLPSESHRKMNKAECGSWERDAGTCTLPALNLLLLTQWSCCRSPFAPSPLSAAVQKWRRVEGWGLAGRQSTQHPFPVLLHIRCHAGASSRVRSPSGVPMSGVREGRGARKCCVRGVRGVAVRGVCVRLCTVRKVVDATVALLAPLARLLRRWKAS